MGAQIMEAYLEIIITKILDWAKIRGAFLEITTIIILEMGYL